MSLKLYAWLNEATSPTCTLRHNRAFGWRALEEAVPDAEKSRSSKNPLVKQILDLGRDHSGTQEGKVVAPLQ